MKLHKALWRHQEVSKNQLMTLVSYAVLYINYCLPWKHATLIACKNPRKHNFYFDLLIFNIAVILKNSSGTKTDTKELQLYKKISSWKVWRGIFINFFFLKFWGNSSVKLLAQAAGLWPFDFSICIVYFSQKTKDYFIWISYSSVFMFAMHMGWITQRK